MGSRAVRFSNRIVAAAVDASLAFIVSAALYLVAHPFSPPAVPLVIFLTSVFATVRVGLAGWADAYGRFTPGRLLCSAGVRDAMAAPLTPGAAVVRRIAADVWLFGAAGAGVAAAAWRSGVGPGAFTGFDWVVAAVVAVDLCGLVVVIVHTAAGAWLWPHDWLCSTSVVAVDPWRYGSRRLPELREPPDLVDEGPVYDEEFRERWAAALAADPQGPFTDPRGPFPYPPPGPDDVAVGQIVLSNSEENLT